MYYVLFVGSLETENSSAFQDAIYICVCVRCEVFTAVTMKNVVFWDIKPQFLLHRRHITSLLQSPTR
jgi:hypothetical protein